MVSQDWERWNTHFSTTVEVGVLGCNLRLAQDPNSQHLGTTVWDSSIVLAKYLEKNSSKGDFARRKVKGKRAIELGAGMGLGGLALALLGCNVLLTDVKEVLPLLQRNYELNLSPAALRAQDSHLVDNVGSVSVQELDWAQPEHVKALGPPFDYVLAADCVYHEHIIEHLLATMLAITHLKSTVMVVNELRSEAVHERFMGLFGEHFSIKKVPRSKMDAVHQHPAIEILLLRRRKPEPTAASDPVADVEEAASAEAPLSHTDQGNGSADDDIDREAGITEATTSLAELTMQHQAGHDQQRPAPSSIPGACTQQAESQAECDDRQDARPHPVLDSSSDWHMKRQGVMAARLLRDVALPQSHSMTTS